MYILSIKLFITTKESNELLMSLISPSPHNYRSGKASPLLKNSTPTIPTSDKRAKHKLRGAFTIYIEKVTTHNAKHLLSHCIAKYYIFALFLLIYIYKIRIWSEITRCFGFVVIRVAAATNGSCKIIMG